MLTYKGFHVGVTDEGEQERICGAGARAGSVRESVTSHEEVRPINAVSIGCSPSSSRMGD